VASRRAGIRLSGGWGGDEQKNGKTVNPAISKVLEDIPGLKPSQAQAGGFIQVGTGSTGDGQADDAALRAAFGLK